MERLLLTLVVLIVVLVAASLTELPGLEARPKYNDIVLQEVRWVRTTQGWEQADWGEATVIAQTPPVTHVDPRVVGILQLLLSLAALLALPTIAKPTNELGKACGL